MHISNAGLAFAVPLGVVVGALIAYLATRRSARESIAGQQQIAAVTLTAQREAAQLAFANQRRLEFEQRLWEKKANLYSRVLTLIDVASLDPVLRFGDPVGDKDEELVTSFFTEYLAHNTEMSLFSPVSVLQTWHKYGEAVFAALRARALVHRDQSGTADEGDAEALAGLTPSAKLRKQLVAVSIAVGLVKTAMGNDLQDIEAADSATEALLSRMFGIGD